MTNRFQANAQVAERSFMAAFLNADGDIGDPEFGIRGDGSIVTKGGLEQNGGGYFNVKAFNAKGDGSTDDTAAFEAWKDAIDAAGGGVAIIPPGEYVLSAWPTFTSHGIRFIGSGARRVESGSETILHYTGSGTFVTFTNVQGGYFEGVFLKDAGGSGTATGIHLSACQNWHFEDVAVDTDFDTRWYLESTSSASCIYNTFINCTGVGSSSSGTGLKMTETANAVNNNTFISCNFGQSAAGIDQTTSCNENTFIGIELASCTTGLTCRGRNTVLIAGNIESCTTGVLIPSGATEAYPVLLGVNFASNSADFTNTGSRPHVLMTAATRPFSLGDSAVGLGGALPPTVGINFSDTQGAPLMQVDGTSVARLTTTSFDMLQPAKVQGQNSQLYAGSGTPEAAVTAAVGSLYLRTDGGASTSLYVKESGAGNTGWVAK